MPSSLESGPLNWWGRSGVGPREALGGGMCTIASVLVKNVLLVKSVILLVRCHITGKYYMINKYYVILLINITNNERLL